MTAKSLSLPVTFYWSTTTPNASPRHVKRVSERFIFARKRKRGKRICCGTWRRAGMRRRSKIRTIRQGRARCHDQEDMLCMDTQTSDECGNNIGILSYDSLAL